MEEAPKLVLTNAHASVQEAIDDASVELGRLQSMVQKTLIRRDQLLTDRQQIERALRDG